MKRKESKGRRSVSKVEKEGVKERQRTDTRRRERKIVGVWGRAVN